MEQGESAVKKLQEMDDSLGLQDPVDVAKRMRGNDPQPPVAAANGALDDTSIAQNLLNQAERMQTEAKGLLAEAERLHKEAYEMSPSLKPKAKRATKKKTATRKTKVNVT
jgi:hypothetical protein